MPVLADVTKRDEVSSMIQSSVKELGPLSTMVANAGIVQVRPNLDLTDEDWERMFRVNVFGVNNCYVEAAKQMIKQGPPPSHPPTEQGLGGVPMPSSGVYKLVGAASIVALKSFALMSHYSASKWAVRGLTQAMAMEMAPHGITVNAYAPGIVGTKMWELIDESIGAMKGAKRGETLKKYSDELIALGRTSVPEDVSNTVHFLASADSDYMTGQTLVCDGKFMDAPPLCCSEIGLLTGDLRGYCFYLTQILCSVGIG